MKDNLLNILGIGVQAVFTAVQSDEVLRRISFAITLVSALITIAYNIYKWWRKSKEDGKISMDEVDELVDIVKDGSDSLTNTIKEGKDNDTRGNGEKTK